MAIDPATEHALRLFLEQVGEGYDVAGAYLYGSRVQRTHRPDSDADVAILLRGEPLHFLHTKLTLADLAYDVLLETGIDISPLPVWLDQWEHPETWTNPRLLENIAREGVRLCAEQTPRQI